MENDEWPSDSNETGKDRGQRLKRTQGSNEDTEVEAPDDKRLRTGGSNAAGSGVSAVAGSSASASAGAGSTAEVVFRMLVGVNRCGNLIGRQGTTIKQLREMTGARIKVSDTVPGVEDRIVVVSSLPPGSESERSVAEVALFRVYQKLAEVEEASAPADEAGMKKGPPLPLRLLVSSSQAGAIIGKGGAMITKLRSETQASVKMEEASPAGVPPTDRVLEIQGEHAQVLEALQAVCAILVRSALKEGVIPQSKAAGDAAVAAAAAAMSAQYQQQQQRPGGAAWNQAAAAAAAAAAMPGGVQWPGYYNLASVGGDGAMMAAGGSAMDPSVLGAQGMAPEEMQKLYWQAYGASPLLSLVTPPQTHVELSLQRGVCGALIGRGGTTISAIRKLSGANIKVHDALEGSGERRVEISGGPEQVMTAQSLILTMTSFAEGRM